MAIRNYIVHNSRLVKAKHVEKVQSYATRLDTYFVAVQNAANSVRQAI